MLNGLRRLIRPSELVDATLPVRDTRVPGSAVIIPNPDSDCSSIAACEDENELVDLGLNGERSRPKNLGDRGDRGELGVGAGAMRTTGAKAASSGCKNGLSKASLGGL